MEKTSPFDTEQHDGPRRTILAVDDNAVILRGLSLKLKSWGYDVATAMDGPTAISMVRKKKPDLILLDVSFPVDAWPGGVAWDGFLIMDWLRRIDEAKNIPFIIITGGDKVKFEKRSLDAGAVAFFRKPIDHEGLLNVIRRTLGETSEPATPGFDKTTFEI